VTGLWLEGIRIARRQRGGELVGVEHKKPRRTYRLLSTRRNSGSDRVGYVRCTLFDIVAAETAVPGSASDASLLLRPSHCWDYVCGLAIGEGSSGCSH